MSEHKHSPLPFKADDCGSPEYLDGIQSQYAVQLGNGYNVAYTFSKDDTAFIVTACNAHYELVEALNRAKYCMCEMQSTAFKIGLEGTIDWDKVAGGSDIFGAIDAIDTALAKARGEQS